jgi:DNA gyrase subunit B
MRPPTNRYDDDAPDGKAVVQVYRPLDHIRLRPDMYIGDTGPDGLHRLVLELVAISINQACLGPCADCAVELLADGGCRVTDDGEGIPVDRVKGGELTVLEVALTHIGVGRGIVPYPSRLGLRGLGLKVVNALSHRLVAEVRRGGRLWRQEYRRGQPCSPPRAVADAAASGMAIAFWPDPDVFLAPHHRRFDFSRLQENLRELSFLRSSMTFRLTDHRPGEEAAEAFRHPDGLSDWVRYLNRGRRTVHPHIVAIRAVDAAGEAAAALQWTTDAGAPQLSCVNAAPTGGGAHLTGLRSAVTQAVNDFLSDSDSPMRLDGESCRAGLTTVVAVNLTAPRFGSATRDLLINTEAHALVRAPVRRGLADFFRSHPADAWAIAAHVRARPEGVV